MKVLLNHFGYYQIERSLARNLVFNTLRCMPEELINYSVYGTVDSIEIIIFRLCSIWAITIFV